MAEWLYEAGIGEDRAALVEDGAIVAARIVRHDGGARAGLVTPARLVDIVRKGALGRVVLPDGAEAMLRPLPPALTLGATAIVRIVREAVPERGRPKRALAVPDDGPPVPAPTLREELAASGHPVRALLPHQPDDLEAAGWSELLEEAATGEIAFPGGALRMTPTPAMTLFDVDGEGDHNGDLGALALAGARATAAAIRRHGIGGSIGIDLPTVAGKAARQAVDALLAELVPDAERTAMNGFGFVQLIRRRARASLPELVQADPALAEALALLRRLERDPQPAVTTPGHVLAWVGDDCRAELARRTGRAIEWRAT